jgi:hypothetical protein
MVTEKMITFLFAYCIPVFILARICVYLVLVFRQQTKRD